MCRSPGRWSPGTGAAVRRRVDCCSLRAGAHAEARAFHSVLPSSSRLRLLAVRPGGEAQREPGGAHRDSARAVREPDRGAHSWLGQRRGASLPGLGALRSGTRARARGGSLRAGRPGGGRDRRESLPFDKAGASSTLPRFRAGSLTTVAGAKAATSGVGQGHHVRLSSDLVRGSRGGRRGVASPCAGSEREKGAVGGGTAKELGERGGGALGERE